MLMSGFFTLPVAAINQILIWYWYLGEMPLSQMWNILKLSNGAYHSLTPLFSDLGQLIDILKN